MNSQVKIVIFICIAVVLSMLLIRSGKKRDVAGHSSVQSKVASDAAVGAQGNPSDQGQKHNQSNSSRDIGRLDYPEIKRSHVGLQTIPYKENAKNVRMLAVDVVPQPVCHRGDLEAIKALVGEGGSMLLTIEPLSHAFSGADSAKVASKRVAVSSLEQGMTTDLELAASADGAYGIYLCSDTQGSGSCASKSPANYNELLSQTSVGSDRDAVFFFQMIVLKKPDAQLFNGTVRDLPDVRQELLSQGLADDQLRKALKRTAATMSAVQSLPPGAAPDGDGRKIILPIAKLDKPSTCRP